MLQFKIAFDVHHCIVLRLPLCKLPFLPRKNPTTVHNFSVRPGKVIHFQWIVWLSVEIAFDLTLQRHPLELFTWNFLRRCNFSINDHRCLGFRIPRHIIHQVSFASCPSWLSFRLVCKCILHRTADRKTSP